LRNEVGTPEITRPPIPTRRRFWAIRLCARVPAV
jgi:hypothetical protein